MGIWKDSPKQDGCICEGPGAVASGKAPFPTEGTVRRDAKAPHPGTGGQLNPRRQRRQDYDPGPGRQREY